MKNGRNKMRAERKVECHIEKTYKLIPDTYGPKAFGLRAWSTEELVKELESRRIAKGRFLAWAYE